MYNFRDDINRGIIFLCKTDKYFFSQIVSLVKGEYFPFPVQEKIFNAVELHQKKYQALPSDDFIIETIRPLLKNGDDIDEYVDELHTINTLLMEDTDNEFYLDLIEQHARKEAMKIALGESIDALERGALHEIEPYVRKAINVTRVIDIGQSYFDEIEARWERFYSDEYKDRFATVFPGINNTLDGGLCRKEIAIVVAPSGRGKSVYLANQAIVSLKEGRKVLYVTCEMSEDRVGNRTDGIITHMNINNLKNEKEEFLRRMAIFKEEFPDAQLMIKEFPTRRATVNTVRACMTQLEIVEGFVPDLVIVDYLEILKPLVDEMEYVAQKRICEDLRAIAIEFDCLVWTATQTNRDGVKTRIIDEKELGESYDKVKPADLVISLNQDEAEYDDGLLRYYIVKSRNGIAKLLGPGRMNRSTLVMDERPIGEESFEVVDKEVIKNVVEQLREAAEAKKLINE